MERNTHGCVYVHVHTRIMLKEPSGGVNKELERGRDMTERRNRKNAGEERCGIFFLVFLDEVYSTACRVRNLPAPPFSDRHSVDLTTKAGGEMRKEIQERDVIKRPRCREDRNLASSLQAVWWREIACFPLSVSDSRAIGLIT